MIGKIGNSVANYLYKFEKIFIWLFWKDTIETTVRADWRFNSNNKKSTATCRTMQQTSCQTPKVDKEPPQKYLRFGLELQNWDSQGWDRCIFSESRFCLYPDSRSLRVWRRESDRYNKNDRLDYVHSGGSSLMIWADINTDFHTKLVVFHKSVTADLYL